MIITLINMNKIIKTHHTPFWNPLETFSSWIRSIRAKVEKQLPHINTLWVFSLCLNLRTLPAIEKSLQLRRAELDEQDKQEFLVWLKENSSYQFFIQLLGEQQQANMFIILSPFFTCKFHRGLWESCLYAFEMKESWFAENDNECILLL